MAASFVAGPLGTLAHFIKVFMLCLGSGPFLLLLILLLRYCEIQGWGLGFGFWVLGLGLGSFL